MITHSQDIKGAITPMLSQETQPSTCYGTTGEWFQSEVLLDRIHVSHLSSGKLSAHLVVGLALVRADKEAHVGIVQAAGQLQGTRHRRKILHLRQLLAVDAALTTVALQPPVHQCCLMPRPFR